MYVKAQKSTPGKRTIRVGTLGDLLADFRTEKFVGCIAITGAWTLNDDQI
jgi:hypothetical protein